jgi:1-acyl-sn-glycerol-3-phosphate acyltransferase
MVRERARQAMRSAGFVGVTAAMLPPFLARMRAAPEARRDAIRDAWVRAWARALLRLFGIETVVGGSLPSRIAPRGRLVVSNHRSAVDVGVLLSTFGGRMVSRADLAGWPVLGAAARAAGTVFVDRANAESGAATIRMIQKLLEERQTIILFPEGTTFDGDEVRPFHGGAFVAAARAEAEIWPVGIAYPRSSGAAFFNETFPEHLARMARAAPTRMAVEVGTPIVAERRGARSLVTNTHAAVGSLVRKARTVAGP